MTAPAPVDVVLRDGSTARVRVAAAPDVPAVRDFLAGLGPEARWFRFSSAGVNLDRAAADAVAPPDGRALSERARALVAIAHPDHRDSLEAQARAAGLWGAR